VRRAKVGYRDILVKSLAELKRTLQPKAKLHLTDYLPEEPPESQKDKLAVDAWRSYKAVSHLNGESHYEEFPPALISQWLEDIGFTEVEYQAITARKKLEWTKGFEEYYSNMKREIAELGDAKIGEVFQQRLDELKEAIETFGATSWSGIYLSMPLLRGYFFVYKSINECSFVFHGFPAPTFKSGYFCRKRARYTATKLCLAELSFN
jgi:hypothetical protein